MMYIKVHIEEAPGWIAKANIVIDGVHLNNNQVVLVNNFPTIKPDGFKRKVLNLLSEEEKNEVKEELKYAYKYFVKKNPQTGLRLYE